MHSAVVHMWLETETARIPVAQVGPDFIIMESHVDLPEVTCGELVVQIDGSESRHRVRLPDGVKNRDTTTQIENLE